MLPYSFKNMAVILPFMKIITSLHTKFWDIQEQAKVNPFFLVLPDCMSEPVSADQRYSTGPERIRVISSWNKAVSQLCELHLLSCHRRSSTCETHYDIFWYRSILNGCNRVAMGIIYDKQNLFNYSKEHTTKHHFDIIFSFLIISGKLEIKNNIWKWKH